MAKLIIVAILSLYTSVVEAAIHPNQYDLRVYEVQFIELLTCDQVEVALKINEYITSESFEEARIFFKQRFDEGLCGWQYIPVESVDWYISNIESFLEPGGKYVPLQLGGGKEAYILYPFLTPEWLNRTGW